MGHRLRVPRPYGERGRGQCVAQPPATHDRQQWDEINRLFRQAVDDLLLVTGIIAPREQPIAGQAFQPVRKNIGRDTLDVLGKQRPKAARAAAEHDVAQDNQAPAVAKGFQREVYWAS